MSHRPTALAATLLLCLSAAACGGAKPPASSASDANAAKKTAVAPKKDVAKDTSADDQLPAGTDVRKVCGIKEVPRATALEDAPKFDFDSSDLTEEEKTVLKQVAECLTTGPLKGRSVALVGRADPRGEPEYNMALGAYRASTVRSYLGNLGVEAHRMKETSRGALDATGTEESSWHDDRRVDITLAN
jgi:peptidoglycan-associated lipoprotein